MTKQLHPNSIVIFYLNGLLASIFIIGTICISIFVLLMGLASEGIISFMGGIIFIIFSIIIVFIIPLPWAYLSYQNYKYELTAETVVIERGVIWKKHVSIPYQRIQNIDILRGPVARMLGLSDLIIQTAGISGVALAEGRIPAVSAEEATKLKEEILAKITKPKNQGL